MPLQPFRMAVLRFNSFTPVPNPPPVKWPDSTFLSVFSGTQGDGNGVGDFWRDVTFGLTNIAPDLFGWFNLDIDPTGNRDMVVQRALQIAQSNGFDPTPYDGLVVWVYPPGSNAGADFSLVKPAALLDQDATQDFLAHEIGHVVGFQHSFGAPNVVYGDPYCIMSARTFGGDHPSFSLSPPPDPSVDPVYWTEMGPSPSGAELYRFSPQIAGIAVPAVAAFNLNSTLAELVALNDPSDPFDPASFSRLVAVDVNGRTFVVEYRRTAAWDRGLSSAGGAPPAVVIHSIDVEEGDPLGRPVFQGDIAVSQPLPVTWVSHDADISVTLLSISPDGSRVEVDIGGGNLFLKLQTSEESQSVMGIGTYTPSNNPCLNGSYNWKSFAIKQGVAVTPNGSPITGSNTLNWSINGVPLPPAGALTSVTINGVNSSFPAPAGPTNSIVNAQLQYRTDPGKLVLENRPQDGNFYVQIALQVNAPDGSPVAEADVTVWFEGQSLTFESRYNLDLNMCLSRLLNIGRTYIEPWPVIIQFNGDPVPYWFGAHGAAVIRTAEYASQKLAKIAPELAQNIATAATMRYQFPVTSASAAIAAAQ